MRAQPRGAAQAGRGAVFKGSQSNLFAMRLSKAMTQQPLNHSLTPSLPGENPGQHTGPSHPSRGGGDSS